MTRRCSGTSIEFQRFDVRKRLSLSKSRNGRQAGVRPGTDDHVRSAQLALAPVTQDDFDGLGSDESSGSENQLRSGLLVILQIHFVQARHHPALALTHRRPCRIVKPSCAMPNSSLWRTYDATFALWMMFLLGRQAMFGHDPPMYLRSMTATRFPSPAKVQAATRRSRAAAENHQVKFFRLRLLKYLGG